jgi:hypothetical protein
MVGRNRTVIPYNAGFFSGTPMVTLTRSGSTVLTVTGPTEIVPTAKWQDLSMVAAEAESP